MFESNTAQFNAVRKSASRGLLVSVGLHAAAIGGLVLSHVPVVVEPEPTARYQRIKLIAPPMQQRQTRAGAIPPKFEPTAAVSRLEDRRWTPRSRPLVREFAAPELEGPKLAIAAAVPAAVENVAIATAELPATPQVRTGVLDDRRHANAESPKPRRATETGVFGSAVEVQDTRRSALAAELGRFESATPAATADRDATVALGAFGDSVGARPGVAGRDDRRAGITGAFDARDSGDAPRGTAGQVRSTLFGQAAASPAPPRRKAQTIPANFDRGVEIVSKPRPEYTDEARRLGVEGEVVLEVLFTAGGEVHVKKLLRGLGHGLDERAVAAAMLISFLPAQREGRTVDIVATVRIQFQLA